MFSYWDANELFDLTPLGNEHKTRYISASTEPFNEEMEIDETKMVNWLDFFKISYDYQTDKEQKTFIRRHVSGHASQRELKELIERINPITIIPIHTTKPELFESIFTGRIVYPKYGQSIEIYGQITQ